MKNKRWGTTRLITKVTRAFPILLIIGGMVLSFASQPLPVVGMSSSDRAADADYFAQADDAIGGVKSADFWKSGEAFAVQAQEGFELTFIDPETDTAVCLPDPTTLEATLLVTVPEGVEARLQVNWYVIAPPDLSTETLYIEAGLVTDGDTFTWEAPWPGIRPEDDSVEIEFGAALIDPETAQIFVTETLDIYWYPYVCPVVGDPTAMLTETVMTPDPDTQTPTVTETVLTPDPDTSTPTFTETPVPDTATPTVTLTETPVDTATPTPTNTPPTVVAPQDTETPTPTPTFTETVVIPTQTRTPTVTNTAVVVTSTSVVIPGPVITATPIVLSGPIITATPIVLIPPPIRATPVVIIPPPIQATPVVIVPPPIQATPQVIIPPPIQATPVVIIPPPIQATPVVIIPEAIQATPVVIIPPPIQATPVVIIPPPIQATPVVIIPEAIQATPVVIVPEPIQATPIVLAPVVITATPVVVAPPLPVTGQEEPPVDKPVIIPTMEVPVEVEAQEVIPVTGADLTHLYAQPAAADNVDMKVAMNLVMAIAGLVSMLAGVIYLFSPNRQ